jgi:hypothetical protein
MAVIRWLPLKIASIAFSGEESFATSGNLLGMASMVNLAQSTVAGFSSYCLDLGLRQQQALERCHHTLLAR